MLCDTEVVWNINNLSGKVAGKCFVMSTILMEKGGHLLREMCS